MDFSKVRDFEYSYYSLADVVPWSALIAPGIVINKDESLMQVFSYAGLDQDSATREELMTMAAKANNYVKRFGEGWCLWFEARRVKANVYKHREFPDVACQLLDNERLVKLQSHLCRKTALMELKFRSYHDNGTA